MVFFYVGHLLAFIPTSLPVRMHMDGLDTVVNLIQELFTPHVFSLGYCT